MKQNEIDKNITNALLSLMEEEDYDSITVTDIVKRAGTSRVTYYRHFTSKEDVILHFFEMTKARFVDQITMNGNEIPSDNSLAIMALFLYFKANIKANKCLRKAGLDGELLKFLSNEFLENLPVKLDKYVAYFVAGALYNVLINWLDNDCQDSIEEISKPFIVAQKALSQG